MRAALPSPRHHNVSLQSNQGALETHPLEDKLLAYVDHVRIRDVIIHR